MIVTMTMLLRKSVLPVVLLVTHSVAVSAEETEGLYRRTVQNWRSRRSYKPWREYTIELQARWQQSNHDPHLHNRLQLVGGFEEGILAIEKETVARGEGTDVARDRALSLLYGAYGQTLLDLTASECRKLALDPHTLLIGVETVPKEDHVGPPSTFLCVENAENALMNSASLDATNTVTQDLLETIMGRDSVHERKPMAFVAELFDSVADTFDDKLIKGLEYVVPRLVGDAARALRPSYRSVLDAGCGTGLAGRHLKPLIVDGVMIGVDASQKMLDVAAKCTTQRGCGLSSGLLKDDNNNNGDKEEALYDDLLVHDLEEMTLQNTLTKGSESGIDSFDLIVAADVLVYFGSVSALLQTFASLSASGAGLIFSCERASDEEAPLGWRLLPTGRFSHTKRHVLEAAAEAGYGLVSYKEIVPRMEKGEEVQGHLFTFVLRGMDEHSEL